jgi:hypothetical protein
MRADDIGQSLSEWVASLPGAFAAGCRRAGPSRQICKSRAPSSGAARHSSPGPCGSQRQLAKLPEMILACACKSDSRSPQCNSGAIQSYFRVTQPSSTEYRQLRLPRQLAARSQIHRQTPSIALALNGARPGQARVAAGGGIQSRVRVNGSYCCATLSDDSGAG